MTETLLRVRDLKTHFFTSAGVVKAVDGVSFDINRGTSMGLCGESGSGKTVTSLSIMRLIPIPGKILQGEVVFDGDDLLKKTEDAMRKIRGYKIAISFQDPMTFLNPVMRVGDQIAETILLHEDVSKDEAIERAIKSMSLAQIPSAEKRAFDYPHQLSAGMRQRIIIAIALACNPELYIADEPTTNLDVIIQDEILDLFKDLRKKLNSFMLITHDLGIAAELCDRVAIMYAGNIVEIGDVETIYGDSAHPYTKALFTAIPRVDWGKQRLKSIRGTVPDLVSPPPGCKFHPRCDYATENCKKQIPKLVEVSKGHFSSCYLTAKR